jgi:hypothetical protein
VLAFASAASAALGCSILDPLDGISDGVRQPDATSEASASTDTGTVDASPDANLDASSPTDAATAPAPCLPEIEPNYEFQPQQIPKGSAVAVCGTLLAAGDSDNFQFDVLRGTTYGIEITLQAPFTDEVFEINGPDTPSSGAFSSPTVTYFVASSAGGPVMIRLRKSGETKSSSPPYELKVARQ